MKSTWFLAAFMLLTPGLLRAQGITQQDGITPYQPYDESSFDTVDLQGGAVQLHIPIISYPQKGHLPPLTLEVIYNQPHWSKLQTYDPPNPPIEMWVYNNSNHSGLVTTPKYLGGSTLDTLQGQNTTYMLPTVLDGTGATHIMYGVYAPAESGYTSTFETVDGTGLNTPSDNETVVDRNGVTYSPNCFIQEVTCSNGTWTYMKDRSGNAVTFNIPGGYTDSIGRAIPVFNDQGLVDPPTGCQTLNFPVVGGATAPITICWQQYSARSDFQVSGVREQTYFFGAISSITLQNSTTWTFTYDSWGFLQSVTTPTGAVMTYTYQPTPSTTYPADLNLGSRFLQTRTLNVNGVESQWSYTYGEATSPSYTETTTVTDPIGDTITHSFPQADNYLEGQTTYTEPNGTGGTIPLETVDYTYVAGVAPVPGFPKLTTTTFPNGQSTTTCTIYDNNSDTTCTVADAPQPGGLGYYDPNYTQIYQQNAPVGPLVLGSKLYSFTYDYVTSGNPGTLLQETTANYLWQTNDSYRAANMLNLVSQTSVSAGGGPLTSSTVTYDEPAYSPTGIYGNPTTSVVGGQITTHTTYNASGMPTALQNDRNYITNITYDATGAYPQSVQSPTTNGVPHIDQYTYDANTGLMTSHTDQNLQKASYDYDVMRRLHTVTYPDGGSEGYTYTDSAPNPQVTVTKAINTTATYGAIEIYDALGRLIHNETTSYPGGTDYVDTTYDSLGRIASVSNPYLTTEDPTYGITSYAYDGLGRKTYQCQQDNGSNTPCTPGSSYLQLAYTGNVTDYYDELRHHWQRTSDALGRLTKVMEPDSSGNPTIETDYGYDALDDLTSVSQLGGSYGPLNRTFHYDALSRLTSSTSPESGTSAYAYLNSSGALCSGDPSAVCLKTNARGVTTTYIYNDPLDRLTGKTYSDSTYPVTYTYDTSTGPNPANTVGRLTDEKTMVQNEAVTERAIDQYDPMGRVVSERQCFLLGCGGGTNYTLTHHYDLAGNMVLSTNGLPSNNANAVTLGYDYNGGGYLQSVTSSLNDALHPQTLFQAMQFSAIGLMKGEDGLPEGSAWPAIIQGFTYDVRARLTGETDSAAAGCGPGIQCSPGPNGPPPGTPFYGYNVVHDGASNVTAQTDSLMGAWGNSYDQLNRLMSAIPGAGAPSGYAGMYLCMNYDGVGNRTQSNWQATACNPTSDLATAKYNSNNRVTWTTVNSAVNGFQYDTSGDVVNDNANMYEYDAEGRQTGVLNQGTGLTGYVYDAEGRRVEKIVVNGFGGPNPTTTVTNEYLLGLNGEQVTVLDGSGNWQRTNVYANGKAMATYDSAGTHFALTDWLGTKRMELSVTGPSTASIEEQCLSLPYGDGQNCTTDVNRLLFTGKERDTESGNDYFGARYYASSMGRWMSPDLPFADQDPSNPQSWNLYGYVRNNPLNSIDDSGLLTIIIGGTGYKAADWNYSHSPLTTEAQSNFHDPAVGFLYWSGGLSDQARIAGAEQLRQMIANYQFAPGEQLNIIAHSYGGDVALAASQLDLTHKIDNLITLGTPNQQDNSSLYAPNWKNIGAWYNVQASTDWVPGLAGGANATNEPGAINYTVPTPGLSHLLGSRTAHTALWQNYPIRNLWWNWWKQLQQQSPTCAQTGAYDTLGTNTGMSGCQ